LLPMDSDDCRSGLVVFVHVAFGLVFAGDGEGAFLNILTHGRGLLKEGYLFVVSETYCDCDQHA